MGGSEKRLLLGCSEKNQLLNGVENGLADVTGTVQNDHRLPEHKLRQTSQALFKMITVCLNTSFESCLPLVSGIVHHTLLELTPWLKLLLQLVFLHFTR